MFLVFQVIWSELVCKQCCFGTIEDLFNGLRRILLRLVIMRAIDVISSVLVFRKESERHSLMEIYGLSCSSIKLVDVSLSLDYVVAISNCIICGPDDVISC